MRAALDLQPCLGNRSGIGTYTYELARRLKNTDKLEFSGRVFDFPGRTELSAAMPDVTMPVEAYGRVPFGVYRRLWHALPLRYGAFFGRADLNIFFDYIVPPRVEGKVLTVLHDMTFLRYPEMMKAGNRRRIERDLPYSVERSDLVITISRFSESEITGLLHVPPEKIRIVSPAPAGSAPEGGAATRADGGDPYILYVGTIEPRKNLVRLIRAFELLKRERRIPHRLVLAGGRGWNSEEIYEAARRSAFSDDITFAGYVDEAAKRALYGGADAFVFPSLYEGFGMPPLEAMSFGCPVVASDAASLPEVTGGAARLVDPFDERSVADGIWDVLSDRDLAGELTRRGYERIKHYTWDASAARLTEICEDVLGV